MNESDVLRHWEDARRITEAQPLLESAFLTNVDVVHGYSLPLRNGKPALPTSAGFGWHQDHVDHVMKEANWHDEQTAFYVTDKTVVVLSFAGGYTYGHWIIDVCARLEIASHIIRNNEDVVYLIPGNPYPWFFPFLEAFGIAPDMCQVIGAKEKLHVERLLVPSMMRVNDYLPSWPYTQSFNRLKGHGQILSMGSESNGKGRRLWVKRTVTIASRSGLDETGLSDLLLEFDFEVVTPASLSIAEQTALFSSAKIIIGEDSSSLHNIVWGKPSLLVVLNVENRLNLLHLSMCKIIGCECRYVFGAEQSDGKFSVDHAAIKQIILEYVSR